MKRQTLTNGVLSIAAVSVLAGCIDDKYDLTDIDSSSRFTVNNLTVPINLSEVKLENVINLDDNENIKEKEINGEKYYAIEKDGKIDPKEFSIDGIHVNSPVLEPSNFAVTLPGQVNVPGQEVDLEAITFPEIPLQSYNFNMKNVDGALKELKDVKTLNPIKVEVALSIKDGISGGSKKISYHNLKIQLPWGMVCTNEGYDKETGVLTIENIAADDEGKARIVLEATGLDLGGKGKVDDNRNLDIVGNLGILSGEIKISVKDAVLSSSLGIQAGYYVSGFDIASFSGSIDYNMKAIDIDPISLNGLPEFLDSPETNIIIANPQILVSINNPVGKYGLRGSGKIQLISSFKNGKTIERESSEFTLIGDHSDFAFCTPKDNYTFVGFDGLRYALSTVENNDVVNAEAEGLPTSIKVNIQDINFAGEVVDFPLGNVGAADGSYDFEAPLGFINGSKVIYETIVDGWSSDTLDDVNINRINVTATCSTNLPVNVWVSVIPINKFGNEIPIKEDNAYFGVLANDQNTPISLSIEGHSEAIRLLDGIKFKAIVSQNSNGSNEALSPDQYILLKDIRVTVDGYYETEK